MERIKDVSNQTEDFFSSSNREKFFGLMIDDCTIGDLRKTYSFAFQVTQGKVICRYCDYESKTISKIYELKSMHELNEFINEQKQL